MAEETPEHRTEVTQRSGDTHVIGADGTARNVDQEARAAEARAAEAAARKRPAAAADSAKAD